MVTSIKDRPPAELTSRLKKKYRRKITELVLQLEDLENNIEEVEEELKNLVLHYGESFDVSNKRLSYYKESKNYDYQSVCSEAPEDVKNEYTTITTSERVAWKKLAIIGLNIDIEDIPSEKVPPRVKIKDLKI